MNVLVMLKNGTKEIVTSINGVILTKTQGEQMKKIILALALFIPLQTQAACPEELTELNGVCVALVKIVETTVTTDQIFDAMAGINE